jgi:hypothetical protein
MAVRAVKVDRLFVSLDTEPLAQHEGEFLVELFCCAPYRGCRQSKRISSTRFRFTLRAQCNGLKAGSAWGHAPG